MSAMNHNLEYLKLLKIPVWQVRGQEVSESIEEPLIQTEALSVTRPIVAPVIEQPIVQSVVNIATEYNSEVSTSLDNCMACQLHAGRTQVITGKGSLSATLMVITEAPTFNEDVAGEPFAEEASKLFDNMLSSLGYMKNDLYITPYVKCAPYQSFITRKEEQQCFMHLTEELNQVQPQKILLLGRNVAKYLLRNTQSFDALRENIHNINVLGKDIPVYVSYNPYQLLKFPEEKRKAWKDIKKLVK